MFYSGIFKGIFCKNYVKIFFIKKNGFCLCGIKLIIGFYFILLVYCNFKFIKCDKICDICIYINYVFW